jgi:hypothetical protein
MLKTRPQKPFPPTPILQSLAHIPHASPFWSLGGLGGNPKVLRLSACTWSVISKASSGFSRIHRKQTLSLPDMKGELAPQSRHCPKPCTDKIMGRVVFSCCYDSFLKGLSPLIFSPTKYVGKIKTTPDNENHRSSAVVYKFFVSGLSISLRSDFSLNSVSLKKRRYVRVFLMHQKLLILVFRNTIWKTEKVQLPCILIRFWEVKRKSMRCLF